MYEKKEHATYKKKPFESDWARFVRISAEVERIWLLYDIDDNGTLDYDEIKTYLVETAYPHLKMNEKSLIQVFKGIDKDGSNSIDKEEMGEFILALMLSNDKIPNT